MLAASDDPLTTSTAPPSVPGAAEQWNVRVMKPTAQEVSTLSLTESSAVNWPASPPPWTNADESRASRLSVAPTGPAMKAGERHLIVQLTSAPTKRRPLKRPAQPPPVMSP